jgi:hypothetical protein
LVEHAGHVGPTNGDSDGCNNNRDNEKNGNHVRGDTMVYEIT